MREERWKTKKNLKLRSGRKMKWGGMRVDLHRTGLRGREGGREERKGKEGGGSSLAGPGGGQAGQEEVA